MLGALERVAERNVLTKWGFDRGGKVCIEWVCHTCQGRYVNVGEETNCVNEHCVSVIAARAIAAVAALDEAELQASEISKAEARGDNGESPLLSVTAVRESAPTGVVNPSAAGGEVSAFPANVGIYQDGPRGGTGEGTSA
jgi:hypothetical protein